MKHNLSTGLFPASLITSSLLLAASANAAFTWNETGAMVYDGTGVDSGINPFTQASDPSNDVSITNTAGSTASLTVQSGSLTINANTSWADKIGHGPTATQNAQGAITVANGASLTFLIDDDNEDRLMFGNGYNAANGGKRGIATITLNGGTLTCADDPANTLAYTHAERQVRFGGDGGIANLALNSGNFIISSVVPVAFGDKWTSNGTVFTAFTTSPSVSTITITNGNFTITNGANGTSAAVFGIGSNDSIDFIDGGTGKLSLFNWTQSQFEALVAAGRITKNGAAAATSDFIYTLNGTQGEYTLNNATPVAPSILTQPPGFVDGTVGGNANFTAVAAGNPSPGLLWEVSTDDGGTWTSTGVTTPTLTLSGLTYSMDGNRYRVIADNDVEPSAVSDESTLFVTYPNPTISAQPVSVGNATAGSSASLFVTASGIGTLTYQWQKSTDAGNTWTDLSGETSDTLTLDPVAHSDAALYRSVITDPAPLAESQPAATSTTNWAYLALANDSPGFVWAPVNSIMTYDGAGADSGINPYTQVGNDIAIGLGNGSSSVLTVSSGTLSIFNVDQWSLKIGQNHVNGHTGTGVVNVSAGATLNLGDTGTGGAIASTEQKVVIGARANGTLNVNGGTVNIHVGPGADTGRSFLIGGSATAGYTGTLSLNSGILNYPSDAPIRIGPDAGTGVVNVNNGHLRVTGTSFLQFGSNDFIDFTVGGTGSIAILGWSSASDPDYLQFKSLIDAGYIRANGVVIPPGAYEAAVFSDDGELGVMQIDPDYVVSPFLAWSAANAGGQGADEDFDGDGVKNGIEYFMNTAAGFTANPQVSGGSVTWPNGGNIAATGYGTRFTVQTSDDLADWDDVLESDPGLSNSAGAVTYTLPAGAGKLFVRLMVTPD